MALDDALGGMRDVPHWFAWRLEWLPDESKYKKTPWRDGRAIDAGDSVNWLTYDDACAAVAALNAHAADAVRYALGYWLNGDCGYWFFDLDKCASEPGVLLPYAQQLADFYAGTLQEWSSSGKGLHIIGRADTIPPHRNKPERDVAARALPMQLEFYSRDRGICFGLSGEAEGCADTLRDVAPLLSQMFPPRVERDSERRTEWRGPEDDDELLRRARNARVSAAAAFGGKATFADLFDGKCERNSENDMALAAHLAFWTGCDEPRIERMMLRSGAKRDKWNERRGSQTWLQYTIANACAGTDNVYQEPQRNLTVQRELYATPVEVVTATEAPQRISPEMFAKVQCLLDEVGACGDQLTLHNDVIPMIERAGVPVALQEQVVTAVGEKLKFWGNKMGVAKLRALLFPPAARAEADSLPEWAKPYCFVANGDRFYNTSNGKFMTMIGFQAVHGDKMPLTEQGRRENAAEKCLHFWGMRKVDEIGYRPDQGPFYEWDGAQFANSYSPSSLPAVATAYTAAGLAGIEAFQTHLYDMCGRRDDVFRNLLYWFAHNVQHPGVKVRWAPILKGVHGDGKTLAASVLRAAMGYRNLSTTSNSNIANSGGFTDWAVRGAVNVIEEIHLTGKVRHQLYNAMKEFISNNIVDVNPKGAKPYQVYNTTNHWANTNHNDAIPLEKTDRRWFVIFTPWADLDGMMTYCGLDAAGWKARTDAIDYAKDHCAGELRAWLLSLPIPPEFDINGSAPMTPEKLRMMASSADDAESAAKAIIAEGAFGVTARVLSSAHLRRALTARAMGGAFTVPETTAFGHMLTRLGYSKSDGYVKWKGETCTIWLQNGVELTNEQARLELDNFQPNFQPA